MYIYVISYLYITFHNYIPILTINSFGGFGCLTAFYLDMHSIAKKVDLLWWSIHPFSVK